MLKIIGEGKMDDDLLNHYKYQINDARTKFRGVKSGQMLDLVSQLI